MTVAPAPGRAFRFACTACGACCNRSPEVALSEAAALADVFVFRLMFRLYDLPPAFVPGNGAAGSSEEYYESRRLLNAFAARKSAVKRRLGGRNVDYVRYLTVSALSLDTGAGACAALRDGRCTIYARRPLACRTVPFHYSRPEAAAERDLRAFVATPGYGCETGAGAPIVLAAGRIVDEGARRARGEALALAAQDRDWAEAILRRLRAGNVAGLPSLGEIEANAPFGATTSSMRVAWRIAAEAGLIEAEACRTLVAAQAEVIDRALASARCGPDARETLTEMRAEYAEQLCAPRAARGLL